MKPEDLKDRVTANLRVIRTVLENNYPDNALFTFRSVDGLYEDWPKYWSFICSELEELKKQRAFHEAFYSTISSGELVDVVRKKIPTASIILNSKGLSNEIVEEISFFIKSKGESIYLHNKYKQRNFKEM